MAAYGYSSPSFRLHPRPMEASKRIVARNGSREDRRRTASSPVPLFVTRNSGCLSRNTSRELEVKRVSGGMKHCQSIQKWEIKSSADSKELMPDRLVALIIFMVLIVIPAGIPGRPRNPESNCVSALAV